MPNCNIIFPICLLIWPMILIVIFLWSDIWSSSLTLQLILLLIKFVTHKSIKVDDVCTTRVSVFIYCRKPLSTRILFKRRLYKLLEFMFILKLPQAIIKRSFEIFSSQGSRTSRTEFLFSLADK